MTHSRFRLLQLTLTVNAVSTALFGVALVVAAAPLAPVLGLTGPWPLVVFGALMLGFALRVWRVRREPLDLREAGTILALDVAYVVATVVILLAWPSVLSPIGRLLAAAVADLVTVFAILEYVGLRRARRAEAPARA
jgi:hypothetical protein